MNKKEIGLLVYGFYVIVYSVLSFMAFMADPITSAMNEKYAFPITMAINIGFVVYAVLFIKYRERKEITP